MSTIEISSSLIPFSSNSVKRNIWSTLYNCVATVFPFKSLTDLISLLATRPSQPLDLSDSNTILKSAPCANGAIVSEDANVQKSICPPTMAFVLSVVDAKSLTVTSTPLSLKKPFSSAR